ncbi:pyrroline-5-carboxylate reductase [Priestia megaterium]
MLAKKLAFIGAGPMAEAMIAGIIESKKLPSNQILVTNKSNQGRLKELEKQYGIQGIVQEELQTNDIDMIILAMPPEGIDKALAFLKKRVKSSQVVISVIAGVTTKYIEETLGNNQQVIRVMPNTASTIGESATAITPGVHVKMKTVLAVKELLGTIGQVYIIEEDLMDVFTGISGSGLAYFYYLVENMERAGLEAGMDDTLASDVAIQTIYGAAKMLKMHDESPTQLRKRVTSPNGTTQAGLEALNEYGGGEAIVQAVKNAASRSNEISK